MKLLRQAVIIFTILLFASFGCSKSGELPVSSDLSIDSAGGDLTVSSPVITSDGTSALGLFGAYELNISPDLKSVDLTPIRSSAIGESYLLSGLSYFTQIPCTDCLKYDNVRVNDDGNIELLMKISHPLEMGDDHDPPSSLNRRDLDVFDVALVILPDQQYMSDYRLMNKSIYSDCLLNADGYTVEMNRVLNLPDADNVLLPYKICYESGNYNNRFHMGYTNKSFKIILNPEGLHFNLFITMGYGVSAKPADRLNPTYYIPEFNRKAAWKVVVTPPGDDHPHPGRTWDDTDTLTEYSVQVDIYDWNHGATVASAFPDPDNPDHILSPSDIESVSVEIPGMTDSLVYADQVTGYSNPYRFEAKLANENKLSQGQYMGLVKVLDSRAPAYPGKLGDPDSFIHSPDGLELQPYLLREFATYQVFTATVVNDVQMEYGGVFSGGERLEAFSVRLDGEENCYVAGGFFGTADFRFDAGFDVKTSNGEADIFLVKIDSSAQHQWAITIGGIDNDWAYDIAFDSSNNIYLIGCFSETVDFDPSSNVDEKVSNGNNDVFVSKFAQDGTYQWTITWGGIDIDRGYSIDVDNNDNIIVGGFFRDTVDFDPSVGVVTRSAAEQDSYLAKYDQDGNLIWVLTWGGMSIFRVLADNSGNVSALGLFSGEVDFDPGPGSNILTSNNNSGDHFLTKFDQDGNHLWAVSWGGQYWDSDIWEPYSGLASDSSGNIYTSGIVHGEADLDPGPGEYLVGSEEYYEIVFLSKFNTGGNFIWAAAWEIGNHGLVMDMTIDNSDCVYITGKFTSTVDFNYGTGVDERSIEDGKLFVTKLDSNRNYRRTITWGGDAGYQQAMGIATDQANNIFVTGSFSNQIDLDPGIEEDIHTAIGSHDVFIEKLSQSP